MENKPFLSLVSDLNDLIKSQAKSGFVLVSIDNFPMIIIAEGISASLNIASSMAKGIQKITGSRKIHHLQNHEFAFIVENCDSTKLKRLKNEIIEFTRGFSNQEESEKSFYISANIGTVLLQEGKTAEYIIDEAYRIAYQRNKDFTSIYDNSEPARLSIHQMKLANHIERSIREKRLKLAFQPIIETDSGKVSHHECLLRIVTSKGSIDSAGSVIQVAERMGFIDKIDVLVLEMVANELKQSKNVSLAFNISNITVNDKTWMQSFSNLVDSDIASRMIIEITETAAARDIKQTAMFVASLQEAGCQVALDDFGSGYTSFRQIRALSVDMIKIDGSLIRDINDNAYNKLLVKSLLDLINSLGIKAVAECVDRGDIAKYLIKSGVHYMQGNYFGPAVNTRVWLN